MLLEHRKWFCCFTLAALALRLLFYFRFPHVTGDSLIYGDIAKNWLDQGIFGLTHAEGVRPTWIRLPGYPAFLVLCFKLFGREHYHAVLLVQIVIDIACCFVIADLARRTLSARAAQMGVRARGALSVHRELHRRSAGGNAQHLLHRRRAWTRQLRASCTSRTASSLEGVDPVAEWLCGRNSVASRRRHPAGCDWPVSAVADVERRGSSSATLLGGSAGAG